MWSAEMPLYSGGPVALDSNGDVVLGGSSTILKVHVPIQDVDGDAQPSSIDCNDADPSVWLGAPEIAGDGVDQDCNGFDTGIVIRQAAYSGGTELRVRATSPLGVTAALRVVAYDGSNNPMTWDAQRSEWALRLPVPRPPVGATVTVYGPEGILVVPAL